MARDKPYDEHPCPVENCGGTVRYIKSTFTIKWTEWDDIVFTYGCIECEFRMQVTVPENIWYRYEGKGDTHE